MRINQDRKLEKSMKLLEKGKESLSIKKMYLLDIMLE